MSHLDPSYTSIIINKKQLDEQDFTFIIAPNLQLAGGALERHGTVHVLYSTINV